MDQKCFCGRPAVIVRKYEGSALCEKHFCESVERKVKKVIRLSGRVDKGSRIAVSMKESGSKVLLHILKKVFEERKDLRISAFSSKKYDKLFTGATLDDEVTRMLTAFVKGADMRSRKLVSPLRELPENEIELYAKLNRIAFKKKKRSGFEKRLADFLDETEAKSSGMKFSTLTTLDELSEL
jgi:tRNA(Ile)-lysidine synthase TilS/MesJ